MTTEAYDWLSAWFRKKAPDTALADGENFFDRGVIDSFGVIELIEEAESRFGIRFAERDFQDRRFPTVDGLAAIIDAKMSGTA